MASTPVCHARTIIQSIMFQMITAMISYCVYHLLYLLYMCYIGRGSVNVFSLTTHSL